MCLRVLHVVTYMGRGGLETMIMNYYRNIDRTKVQFDFLVHRDFEADYDQEILSLGGKIYRIPQLNPFSKEYLFQLDCFFKKHTEYKIVHSHLDCVAGIPLKYAKKHGIPIRIAHAHNTNQAKDLKYPLKMIYKQNITKFATHLFACSQDAGKWMFNTAVFQVLNNAIDTTKYLFNDIVRKKVREELKIDENDYVIGHVGRFAPQKNHLFLCEVFQKVVKIYPNSKLLLVGNGDMLSEIQKKIDSLSVSDKVIFTGVRSDVHKILQAMDVFVFPSLYEGLPVTLIEAQTAGLPCIISDRVPIECKKTALVNQVSLDDSTDRWTEKIMSYVNYHREDMTKEMINSGYDIQKNAEWLEKYYLNLMK